MSAFLEEYGKVIVVVVVVAALIILATVFKRKGSEAANTSFNNFTSVAEKASSKSMEKVETELSKDD